VIAARTVVAIQTLVSREKDPLDPAVVTVGSIHGGTRYNIIPDEVKLQITLRTFNPEVRQLLLSGIERVAKAEAALKPATASAAHGRETSIAFNRRFHMTDGTVGWNPGKRNPKVVRPAGPTDPAVPVVYVETDGKDPKPIAAYVNFAMHLDTVGGLYFSADYAHTLSKCLAAAKGEGLVTVAREGEADLSFSQGAACPNCGPCRAFPVCACRAPASLGARAPTVPQAAPPAR